MLKKRNRLRLRQEKHFFSESVRFSYAGFSLFVRNVSHQTPQLGCIVSKKTADSAVDRHTLRRSALAICETGIQNNSIPSIEYVIVLQKNFLKQDKSQILRELQDGGNKVYSSTGK